MAKAKKSGNQMMIDLAKAMEQRRPGRFFESNVQVQFIKNKPSSGSKMNTKKKGR